MPLIIYIYITVIFSINKIFNAIADGTYESQKNIRCCSPVFDSCRVPPKPPTFELKAMIQGCPTCNRNKSTCSSCNSCNEQSIDMRGEAFHTCKEKLQITLRLVSEGIADCKHQFVVVDHVYDELTNQKQRLLFPYVIRLTQTPLYQTYGMVYETTVNAEANEKVFSKRDANYKGCHIENQNPTCGSLSYNGKIVPFSTGFCCSCDENKNYNRELQIKKHSGRSPNFLKDIISGRVARNLDQFFLPPNSRFGYNSRKNPFLVYKDKDRLKNEDWVIHIPEGLTFDVSYSNQESNKNEEKVNNGKLNLAQKNGPDIFDTRQDGGTREKIVQKRGGQDCQNFETPEHADPNTYHDSTHCLDFSNLWYSVYKLQKPRIAHGVSFEIFEKHQDCSGRTVWKDITQGKPIVVGTDSSHFTASRVAQSAVSAKYHNDQDFAPNFAIDYSANSLLIPDESKGGGGADHTGGPCEYLVLPKDVIDSSGGSCNKAGVGFEAFATQPDRCNQPQGSCLMNQPRQFYDEDRKADDRGAGGSYFLKNFAPLPLNPIQSVSKGSATLNLYYTDVYSSVIDIELDSSDNTIMRRDTTAVITEAYVDCTDIRKAKVTAKVTNYGLVSGSYYVVLRDCPLNAPAGLNNIASQTVHIPPQQQHVYNLQIECPLPKKKFKCSLQVFNVRDELLAVRIVRFHKNDRCICIWHCHCACLEADNGLKCVPMSLDSYNAAGFQGGLPMATHLIQYTVLDQIIIFLINFFLILFLILLLLGLLKAIIGLFFIPIGLWGLDRLLGLPKPIPSYHERKIRDRNVVYDKSGWPIHPDTSKKVHNVGIPVEFAINVIFFFLYPITFCYLLFKKLLKRDRQAPICTCAERMPKKVSQRSSCKGRKTVQSSSLSFEQRESLKNFKKPKESTASSKVSGSKCSRRRTVTPATGSDAVSISQTESEVASVDPTDALSNFFVPRYSQGTQH